MVLSIKYPFSIVCLSKISSIAAAAQDTTTYIITSSQEEEEIPTLKENLKNLPTQSITSIDNPKIANFGLPPRIQRNYSTLYNPIGLYTITNPAQISQIFQISF